MIIITGPSSSSSTSSSNSSSNSSSSSSSTSSSNSSSNSSSITAERRPIFPKSGLILSAYNQLCCCYKSFGYDPYSLRVKPKTKSNCCFLICKVTSETNATQDQKRTVLFSPAISRPEFKRRMCMQTKYLSPTRRLCNRRCLTVCLSFSNNAKHFRTDLHEIFGEGWQWTNEQTIKFWWWIRIATLVRRALAQVCTLSQCF